MKPSFTTEVYNPDRLIAGDENIITRDETLITGQNLKRGALLGKITASGKLTLSLAAAVDGSEVPFGILVDDIDATAADKVAPMYMKGEFDEGEMTFGTGHTADSVRDGLRRLGIHMKTSVPA